MSCPKSTYNPNPNYNETAGAIENPSMPKSPWYKSKPLVILGGLVFIGATGCVAYMLHAGYKMHKVANRLDKTIDDLACNVDIPIDEKIIREVVETAAYREASQFSKSAAEKVKKDVQHDIFQKVCNAVNSAYSDVKSIVEKELRRKVGTIDISEIRKEIIEQAKNRATEKFEEELDDILDGFNENLENVTKIYSSIAQTMLKKT